MSRATKNWIIIGVIGICLVSVFLFFTSAMEPYSSARTQANKIAKKSANINNPDYFANFTQEKHFYTVGGTNDKNKYHYVIINAKTGTIKILKDNNHSREEILNTVKTKYQPQKINHINLGIIDKKPTWEVSFVNKNHSTGYAMVDYKNGKIKQTINNI